MIVRLLFTLFFGGLAATAVLQAQPCSDGSAPELVTLNMAGRQSIDGIDDGDNQTGVLTFSQAGDIVAVEFANYNFNTVGGSFCIEALLLVENSALEGVVFTPSLQNDVGPCTDLPFDEFIDLVAEDLVFPTNASGTVLWQLFEDFDDNPNAADATYTSGMVTLYRCPTGQTLLPVTLLAFTAEAKEKDIQLDWATSNEVDNEGFAVERSTDGTEWRQVGWVTGAGEQEAEQTYSFMDQSVMPGATYFYRLKQMDYDQTFTYSEVVQAQLQQALVDGVFMGQVFPNPAPSAQAANLEIFLENPTQVDIVITNFAGQQLRSQRMNLSAGAQKLELNTIDLPTGLYLASFNLAGKAIHRKFEVQR
ncbi:T9SS type A sorting domain-containing protein [Neolewinella lacunae]|uniref:T9SS type A sorting domain-containing protein n=1 Tax=Neolewinella lacunae TaxID=1517758 RepID=A0A923PSB6_9BACT|nr:T9SS type A sorting domain-containing protein [Neolewinella lacunae]MBC6996589.1 T9SS type A sorting domain-containing protein [Neolewinella lacunae]MDN3634847.1 T9SS type A sorting domain-containing protein [Neolewinella lacunae]